MSTRNIHFHGEIRKISKLLNWKKHLIKSYVMESSHEQIRMQDNSQNGVLLEWNHLNYGWIRIMNV